MPTMDDLIAGWQRRIILLQQENHLMENGKMKIRETKLVDGKLIENDLTEESIKKNNEWISQLEKLIVFVQSEK